MSDYVAEAVRKIVAFTPCRPCAHCGGSGRELDPAALGAALRQKRRSAGLTLSDVALSMRISIAYASDLERGRRNWSTSLLERYLSALPSP